MNIQKSIFNSSFSNNIENIKKKCKKYKYISFDVFDTLIKRNVSNPYDIFELMNYDAEKMGISNFNEIRLNAEAKIRRNKNFVNINEIYGEIENLIGIDNSNKLKKIEIELERSYCQKNKDIYELYKHLKKAGKKIIAISDMYLTADIIKTILEDNDIIVDSVYVSCECNSKKTNGSLFKYVINKEKIDKRDIIHIGDSWKADYFGAKRNRIASVHIARKKTILNSSKYKKKMHEKNKYEVYESVINNNLSNTDNYYYKFGFSILGPLVYNYCLWLKKECEKENINRIFFFSRDGYVLKKGFDSLFPKEFETNYIYFSRRAIRIPYAAYYSTYDDIMKFFPKTKMITMKVYFENFGLNPKKYLRLLNKYNLKLDDEVLYNDIISSPIYRDIFNEIYDDIILEANKEKDILKKYINQENFKGKIAIVDVGWHNSMQFYLEKIAQKNKAELNMFGFYLGILSNEKKVNFSKSFIREKDNEQYVESVLAFIGLIESVFLAQEGSTKTYFEKNKKIYPELLDYEYSKSDMEYDAFKYIRNGILSFIEIVSRLLNFDTYLLDGYDAFLPLKSFGINPYLYDVKQFSRFRYFSEETVYFSNAKSIVYYLLHLNELKNDIYHARWKVGFMKELLKINLPYLEIYKKLKG